MIKMLLFDFREQEKQFFETPNHKDFDITFYSHKLNENTELTQEEFDEVKAMLLKEI